MISIDGILKEELERLRQAEESYRREIRALPKGSLQKKRIKGRVYPYLVSRMGRKVVSRYMGKEDVDKLRQNIELRHRQERLLRQVRDNIVRIQRMINGTRNPARRVS